MREIPYYVLDENGEARPARDIEEFLLFFKNSSARFVACREEGGVKVSTVFLSVDHSFGPTAPVLWETLVFGGRHDGTCWRYSTRAEAREGHKRACARVFGKEPGPTHLRLVTQPRLAGGK